MSKLPYPVRPDVLAFEPYTPGLSIDEIRQKYGLSDVVKMASNENALGTSPVVQKALCDYAPFAFRYAQSGNPDLVKALSRHHNVPEEHIVPGNGSDEVIDLLLRVCPTPGVHNVVASDPSFSMYRIQSKLCGVEFRAVPLHDDFSFDWDCLLGAVDDKTALVFITTPDNPSGYCPPVSEVERFAASLPESCLLVIDEAYMDFCEDGAKNSLLSRFGEFPRLVILRTFSKSFGLAGIRLGYGIMPKELAAAMRSAHMPFSVNIMAEAAGIAALKDTTFYEATIKAVREGRSFLTQKLEGLGCRVYPSGANFLMFGLPKACAKPALEVFESLLEQGVIIRPLKSYGLAHLLRVSVGTEQENALFIKKLEGILS